MRKPDYILDAEGFDNQRDIRDEKTLHGNTLPYVLSQWEDHERALDDALPPPLPRGYKTAAARARVLLVAAGFNPDEVPGARLPPRRYRHNGG